MTETKREQVQDSFLDYFQHLERVYGPGLSYDTLQDHVTDPVTGEPISSQLLTTVLREHVRDGTLSMIGAGDDVYYWSDDLPADISSVDEVYEEIITATSAEIDADPYPPGHGDWDEIRETELEPLHYPAEETPYGNTLPVWDAEQTYNWVRRNNWITQEAVNDMHGDATTVTATTTVNDGTVTMEYTVEDADELTTVEMRGIFRKPVGDEHAVAPGSPQRRYLASVLHDIGTPNRFARLNREVIEAAADINSFTDLGRYQDALDELRGLGARYRERRDETGRAAAWARRKGQLQGIIRAKESGRDIPDRFRSDGNLAGLAEQDIGTLRQYLDAVNQRVDDGLVSDHSTYGAIDGLHGFLVELVRDDSGLKQRQWADDIADDALLDAVSTGRGGQAAENVAAKWDEYIDAYERRLVDTVRAKL